MRVVDATRRHESRQWGKAIAKSVLLQTTHRRPRGLVALIAVFAALQFLPPVAGRGYDLPEEAFTVASAVLREPLWSPKSLYPLFKLGPLLATIAVLCCPPSFSRLFFTVMGLCFLSTIPHQAIGLTQEYGLVINVGCVVMFTAVAAVWLWEAAACRTSLPRPSCGPLNCLALAAALVALWYPLDPATAAPDFDPTYLWSNGAGMAFCMVTPLALAVLLTFRSLVSRRVLEVTSTAGLVAGAGNLYINFWMEPAALWWNGVLHLPLVVLSAWGLAVLAAQPEPTSAAGTLL